MKSLVSMLTYFFILLAVNRLNKFNYRIFHFFIFTPYFFGYILINSANVNMVYLIGFYLFSSVFLIYMNNILISEKKEKSNLQ